MRELEILGVRLDLPSRPLLLLRDAQSDRCLPIWIGVAEATAIVTAMDGVDAPRPLTHDLLAELLAELGHAAVSGTITDMKDGVFLAELQVDDHVVQARPSDVVALAVRMGFEVSCPAELLDRVGIDLEPESEDELERFREFLDNVTPEDFEAED